MSDYLNCSNCLKEDVCNQKIWVTRLLDSISKIELQGSNEIYTMDEIINLFDLSVDVKCYRYLQNIKSR